MNERGRGGIAGLSSRLGWQRLQLRSRLALIAALAVAVAVVAVSAVVFFAVSAQLHHQLDVQLAADAQTIAESPEDWTSGTDPDHDHDRDVGPRVQILDGSGNPVLPAGELTRLPITPAALAVVKGKRPRVFEDVRFAGDEFRMLTVPAEHGGTVQVAVSEDVVDRPLGQLNLILLIVSVGGVAAAAGLGFVVARTGLAPVHRLTEAVEHVTATSDLGGRIEVGGRDEVARLARAFNAMLGALQSSRDAQRLLVEDAGHELRTPLTSLRANIELLVRSDGQSDGGRRLSAADRAGLLHDLDVQSTELAQLVGELVELARDGDGAEPVERVDLAELVDLTAQRVRQRWPGTDFALELDQVSVPGRSASLDRMITNLLDNAAKWSPSGTAVRVGLHSMPHPPDRQAVGAGRWVELTVADSGPGIDERDLPLIFERFYRATSARAMPGTGLGLAIVAQAVELHEGTVTAGRSDTGGALFRVRLPAAG